MILLMHGQKLLMQTFFKLLLKKNV